MTPSTARPSSSTLASLLFLALLALLAVACGGPAEPPADDTAAPAAESTSEGNGGDAVEYEPAYPEDVSTKDLSESDTAQQHDHGEGDHEHGEGENEHGDEGDDSHGDDHSH